MCTVSSFFRNINVCVYIGLRQDFLNLVIWKVEIIGNSVSKIFKMLGLKRHDTRSEFCRFPRGKCSCPENFSYSRLHERAEEGWAEVDYGGDRDNPSTSSGEGAQELVFFNDNESSQSVVVERNLCASDLCQLLAMKNRVAKSVHWTIMEYWADLGLERPLEDHEYVLEAYKDTQNFSHHARFNYKFRKDFRKYEFFHYPQQFFPTSMLEADEEDGADHNKNPDHAYLLHMIGHEAKCPIIFSDVWLRDNHKKAWVKGCMLLRDQKLFVSHKIQSLSKFVRIAKERSIEMISEGKETSGDIRVFADVRRYHAYATLNAKNQFGAPSEWGVVLRPVAPSIAASTSTADPRGHDNGASGSASSAGDRQLRCLACDSERVRSCWLTAMRLAKYGKQLRENYRAFRNKQNDNINTKDYNSYSVPNESVRSRVAMDFTGAVGRIVEDEREATAIAAAEGYSWNRRWRGCVRPPPPGRPAAAVDGVHTTQPWFHAGMTRDRAAELVARHGTVDGVFLVRDSRSHTGSFVITYKCGSKILHAQVNPILDPLRDRAVFSIDNGVTKFYDLLQLVEFYQLNAGCLPTRLTHYVTFLLSGGESNIENKEPEKPNVAQNRGANTSGSE